MKKRTQQRLEENSGLIDLDALIEKMKDETQPPQPPTLRAMPSPSRTHRRPAVVAVVLLSMGGNAISLASAAASTFSSRRKTEAPTASVSVASRELPETERPPSKRGITVATANEPPATVRSKLELDLPVEPTNASYAPRHAVPPPPPLPRDPSEPPESPGAVIVPAEVPRPTLDDAMRTAVGQSAPTVGPPRAAIVASASVPRDAPQLHPAPGAVLVALGGAQVAARRCLDPEDAPRSFAVVFGSDGHVARVESLSGAVDDAKGSCIRGALAQARVGPFAEETYRTRITIRP